MTVEGFEVFDALGGLCRLTRRTPTLDGAVPVRVAQGCVPLLEGNRFGVQVTLTTAGTVERTLGRTRVTLDDARRWAALAEGALTRLVAEGGVTASLAAPLRRVAWVERSVVHLWTGLLVRTLPGLGLGLRVAGAANRRNRNLEVEEGWLPGPAFAPLTIRFRVPSGRARLEGEIACLSLHPCAAALREIDLAQAPEIGKRHAAFFDEAYFEEKKRHVTGRYRRLPGRARAPRQLAPAGLDAVRLGPGRLEPVADSAGGPARLVFANAVGFEALFDGHTLTVTPDRAALDAGAAAVERAWAEVYGADAVARDRRALWYLTKYFTPHPPGEPHFFVKPWAFVRTPAGWSTLVDGICGAGYDVMRGVVSTDVFHAAPAVFALHTSGTAIRVAAGTPLTALFPVPRWTLEASWRLLDWSALSAP